MKPKSDEARRDDQPPHAHGKAEAKHGKEIAKPAKAAQPGKDESRRGEKSPPAHGKTEPKHGKAEAKPSKADQKHGKESPKPGMEAEKPAKADAKHGKADAAHGKVEKVSMKQKLAERHAAMSAAPQKIDKAEYPMTGKALDRGLVPKAAIVESKSGKQKLVVDKTEFSKNMMSLDPFVALALQLEDVKLKPYSDSANLLTIGVGYCIDERLRSLTKLHGRSAAREKVEDDLAAAGLTAKQAQGLMDHDPIAVSKVRINPEGALALLERVRPDYEKSAKNSVGDDSWGKLSSTRKAALTYRAYNGGALPKGLVEAVKKGDDVAAMKGGNLVPVWIKKEKDSKGRMHKEEVVNDRARAFMQAAWVGGKVFKDALMDPHWFDRQPDESKSTAAMAKLLPSSQTVKERLAHSRAEEGSRAAADSKAQAPAAPQEGKPKGFLSRWLG